MTKSLENDISNLEYAAKNNISKFDAIANRAWVNGRIPYTFSRGFSTYLDQLLNVKALLNPRGGLFIFSVLEGAY